MRSLILLLLVAGCAKSAGLPGATGAEPPAATAELDALERDLSAGELELGKEIDLKHAAPETESFAADKKKDDGDEAREGAEKPKTSRSEAPAAESPPAQAPAEERSSPEPSCDRVCRALGSMRRSAERICVLASEDLRCVRARQRVKDAETRVAAAGCSCDAESPPEGGA